MNIRSIPGSFIQAPDIIYINDINLMWYYYTPSQIMTKLSFRYLTTNMLNMTVYNNTRIDNMLSRLKNKHIVLFIEGFNESNYNDFYYIFDKIIRSGCIIDVFKMVNCSIDNYIDTKTCHSIDVDSNNLFTLNILDFSNCQILSCENNKLKSLPELPKCQYLYCNNNKLTKLPKLEKCVYLECRNNQLKRISDLPNCVIIDASDNNLVVMPYNIPKCLELFINNNNIEQGVKINDDIQILHIKNNPKDSKKKINCHVLKQRNPSLDELECEGIQTPIPMLNPKFNFPKDTTIQLEFPSRLKRKREDEEEQRPAKRAKLTKENMEFINFINDVKNDLNDVDTLNHISSVFFDGLSNNDYTINEVIDLLPNLNENRLLKIFDNISKQNGFLTKEEYLSKTESDDVYKLLRVLLQRQQQISDKPLDILAKAREEIKQQRFSDVYNYGNIDITNDKDVEVYWYVTRPTLIDISKKM